MASSRRAWFASFTARAMQRSSSASKSSRTVIGALILVPPNQWIRVEMNHTAASIAKSQPFQRLVLDLQASGIAESVDELSRLTQTFLDDLADHRKRQPFELWMENDTASFKQAKDYWPALCQALD